MKAESKEKEEKKEKEEILSTLKSILLLFSERHRQYAESVELLLGRSSFYFAHDTPLSPSPLLLEKDLLMVERCARMEEDLVRDGRAMAKRMEDLRAAYRQSEGADPFERTEAQKTPELSAVLKTARREFERAGTLQEQLMTRLEEMGRENKMLRASLDRTRSLLRQYSPSSERLEFSSQFVDRKG